MRGPREVLGVSVVGAPPEGTVCRIPRSWCARLYLTPAFTSQLHGAPGQVLGGCVDRFPTSAA